MPAYKDAKTNTWYVKFRYKNWKKETKNQMKRGFPTKREALEWEREFLQMQAGDLEMSFEAFVKVYLKDRRPRIKESTMITKENILEQQIIPFFRNMSIQEIDTADVLKWQNELLSFRDPETKKPYTKSYLKTIHNQLSAIFNHAVRYYGLRSNPAKLVGNMGSEADLEMKIWTREQYRKFSEVMMDIPLAYYAFEVLYWAGIREGELLALTPDDIDFHEKTISVTKTFQVLHGKPVITDPKTPQSKRVVSISDFLCEELKDYFKMIYALQPTERAFPVTKHYLNDRIHAGAKQVGLPEIRVHDLRHSHVSLLIDMGYSAVAIAKRMGHKSVEVTYRYAHLFPTVQSDIAVRLNELGGGMNVG